MLRVNTCFLFFVVYCCRGILVIFFYYNVWSMLVASPICACIILLLNSMLRLFTFSFLTINVWSMLVASPIFVLEFNASAFYLSSCACITNLFLFFFFLLTYCVTVSLCKSQYHPYYSFPPHGARDVRATFVSFCLSINDCMII